MFLSRIDKIFCKKLPKLENIFMFHNCFNNPNYTNKQERIAFLGYPYLSNIA